MIRAARALGALVLGFLACLAALLLHQYVWGFALGVLACVTTWLALPAHWWGRPVFGLAWALVAGYGTVTRPEGDFLIPANALGYAFLGWAFVVLLAGVVTWPTRTRVPWNQGSVTDSA